jgi:hypothetical protein
MESHNMGEKIGWVPLKFWMRKERHSKNGGLKKREMKEWKRTKGKYI